MAPDRFVTNLTKVSLPNVFNPYSDHCSLSDLPDAAKIRQRNLISFLEIATQGIDTIWFGRDLGYRGGRRTGIALTDEFHLDAFRASYEGVHVRQATSGPPLAERTATFVWEMIRQLPAPPFLWNVFPFHPHENDEPMSNRCHTAAERKACAKLIEDLFELVQPRLVIAIGKDAYTTLTNHGYDCQYVRHPSYGGQSEFFEGIQNLYGFVAQRNAPPKNIKPSR